MPSINGDRPVVVQTEAENLAELLPLLEPHFEINTEVRLRDPNSGHDRRIDIVVRPRQQLVDALFPFDLVGIEVKPTEQDGADRIQALKQCVDYQQSVIYSSKMATWSGLYLHATFLYTGSDPRPYWHHSVDGSDFGLLRFAAKFNVGRLHNNYGDLAMVMAQSHTIWSSRWPDGGVSGSGARWPRSRRLAHSKQRRANPREGS